MLRLWLLFMILLEILVLQVNAQAPATDTLKLLPVEISETPLLQRVPGAVTTTLDSSDLTVPAEDAGTLLRMHSTVFIKSYGQNGSSTISVRGTEARHTAVLWNGFNINSASMGMTDLSLIPAASLSGLTLIHGGTSSVFGNASLGGTLMLEKPAPRFGGGIAWTADVSAGSFGCLGASGGITASGNRFYSHTSFLIAASDNDFEFENSAQQDHPVMKQEHAHSEGYTLTEDIAFRTGNSGLLSASLWYQVSGREIPPTMMETVSEAIQRDSILRTAIAWKTGGKKTMFEISGAWFNEHQRYEDSRYDLYTWYKMQTWAGHTGVTVLLRESLKFTGGLNYQFQHADFVEYADDHNRQTYALYGGLILQMKNALAASLNLRKEYSDFENAPLCPSVFAEGAIVQNLLNIHVSGGRNYSLPTLNDLYWKPGGNTELRPEDSWTVESGMTLFPDSSRLPLTTFTAYYTNTTDWIKWVPADGGIYRAENIDQVISKGIETSVSLKSMIRRVALVSRLAYAYTSSVRQETASGQSALEGKQLIYVPYHTVSFNLSAAFKTWNLSYDQNYTGIRYTTADNQSSLDDFTIADLCLSKMTSLKGGNLTVYIKLLNIWDASYQVVAWRPMPGRWIMAGITLTQHKHNKPTLK